MRNSNPSVSNPDVQRVQISQSLQRNRASLERYVATHTQYSEKEAQSRLEAVRLAKAGQKAQSLFHVNTALRLQKHMNALQSIIGNLQDSIYNLELTSHAMEAAGDIRVGSHALRAVNGDDVVTNIEDVMESLNEDADAADDIAGALESGTAPAQDAEAVLAEWMEASPASHQPVHMPDVPSTELVPPQSQTDATERVRLMQLDMQ